MSDVDSLAYQGAGPAAGGYVIPRYRVEGAALYHFLHGTVPGHQIDFMYSPEVPQGALRQTHVGHLARLIKYIEPRASATYAFAIGNLSRDDVQHSPGHGGLAVLFALRVPGVVDHAGRDTPPYAHGVVAVDRHLDYVTLLEATTVLYRRFLEREGAEDRRGDFYRSYVHMMRETPGEVPDFLAHAISEFDDLPAPRKSGLTWDYAADEGEPARNIAIVHDEPMDFVAIAHSASALAAILYRSNIKWTSISTGREIDIAGGTTIRFVPRGEASTGLRGLVFELDDLPEDEDALATKLFGAKRRGLAAPAPRQGWRAAMAEQRVGPSEPPPSFDVHVEVDDAAATLPVASPLEAAPAFDPRRSSSVAGQRGVDLSAAVMARIGGGAGGPAGAGGGVEPGPASAVMRAPGALAPQAMPGVGALASAFEAASTGVAPSSLSAGPPSIGARAADGAVVSSRGGAPVGGAAPRARWIIIAAALAAVAVVVMVVMAVGMSGEGSGAVESGRGSGAESGDAPTGVPAPSSAASAPSARPSGAGAVTPGAPGSSASTGATASATVQIMPPVSVTVGSKPSSAPTRTKTSPKPTGKVPPPVRF